jgi:hypothetical protein
MAVGLRNNREEKEDIARKILVNAVYIVEQFILK